MNGWGWIAGIRPVAEQSKCKRERESARRKKVILSNKTNSFGQVRAIALFPPGLTTMEEGASVEGGPFGKITNLKTKYNKNYTSFGFGGVGPPCRH